MTLKQIKTKLKDLFEWSFHLKFLKITSVIRNILRGSMISLSILAFLKIYELKKNTKQAEKLKSREIKEGWMKNDEVWIKNDEGWWYQVVEGFCRQTDRRTNGHLWM